MQSSSTNVLFDTYDLEKGAPVEAVPGATKPTASKGKGSMLFTVCLVAFAALAGAGLTLAAVVYADHHHHHAHNAPNVSAGLEVTSTANATAARRSLGGSSDSHTVNGVNYTRSGAEVLLDQYPDVYSINGSMTFVDNAVLEGVGMSYYSDVEWFVGAPVGLLVAGNPVLLYFDGFINIATRPAFVSIMSNPRLKVFNGLTDIVGTGDLEVVSNERLKSFALPYAEEITVVNITGNGRLQQLSLPVLTKVADSIVIEGNEALPEAEVARLMSQLTCKPSGACARCTARVNALPTCN